MRSDIRKHYRKRGHRRYEAFFRAHEFGAYLRVVLRQRDRSQSIDREGDVEELARRRSDVVYTEEMCVI